MDVPVIELAGVLKSFGPVDVLKGVDFKAYGGKVTALVGDNGAGKSTMLGCISGTLEQNEGTIFIGETSVGKTSPQKRASMGMARTFQGPQLVTELTVREHVVLAARAGKPVDYAEASRVHAAILLGDKVVQEAF